LNGNPLRLRSRYGANAKLLGGLTPISAGLEPGEVDPLAVGAPPDIGGLATVQLRPSHDVPDREVERLRCLGGDCCRPKHHRCRHSDARHHAMGADWILERHYVRSRSGNRAMTDWLRR